MIASQNDSLQVAFRGLADTTRRDILMLLSHQDMTIGDVAGRYDITRAAVKKHLVILQEGNLISVHPRGRERVNRFNPAGLKPAADWLSYFDAFWDDRLQALQKAVDEEEKRK